MSQLVLRYDALSCTLSWYGMAGMVAVSIAVGVYLGCKWNDLRAWMNKTAAG